jgi:transcriptional regulator with XRE-family HTH domain
MSLPTASGGIRTARGRQLAARLLELREAREPAMSRKQAAEQLKLGYTTMYRIETGAATPQARTLESLLDMYEVAGQERADLMALAAGARTVDGWFRAYSDVLPEQYMDYIGFEADADRLDNYESLLIPGLLQTKDYARAVITGAVRKATANEVDRRVKVRMKRQEELAKPDPVHLNAVIDEAALWRVVGSPAIMSAQLKSLLEPRPNVRLQVIPYAAGAHPGMIGSFVILHFADLTAADLVYIDSMAGDLFRESEADRSRFRDIFTDLTKLALTVEDSAALIRSAARKHHR